MAVATSSHDLAGGPYSLAPVLSLGIEPAADGYVRWKSATGGDWGTPSNWSTGEVPASSQDAIIAIAGTYTVIVTALAMANVLVIADTGAQVFDTGALELGETLKVSAGRRGLTGPAPR
jgi:hypothetical protein